MNFEELVVANNIIFDVEDAEEEMLVPDRQFRRRENAFELSDKKFQKLFRASKPVARQIIEMVSPLMQEPSRTSALSVELKVLVALSFFATGSYQEITGSNICTGVSQSSVSRSIRDVCEALNNPQIFEQWVRFPRNIQELRNLRQRFFLKYQFPGIIGCIDCTHVAIVAPKSNDPLHPEHIYVNRKNYHSLNVQLVCDESLRILNVNARFPGSSHDAHIWRQSAVSDLMETIYRNNANDIFFLLGDSGYPLRPWLMTPLRDVEPNSPAERFNNLLKRIRSTIERCNGLLKNRFRCLLKHRVLHYGPEMAGKIVNACVVLHNIFLENNLEEPDVIAEEQEDLVLFAERDPQNADLAAARRLQQHIIETHFNH